MKLGELLDHIIGLTAIDGLAAVAPARRDQRVSAIDYDSRRVGPGSVFVALRGQRADGVVFADQAASRGAIAIVAEVPPPDGWAGLWLTARDAREALAALAATYYRHPSENLLVVGVTGTNGKTTTTYLLRSIFEQAGLRCGMVGTVGYIIGGAERAASRTTPEAPDVQRLLGEMVEERCDACAMEVSSHALALRRVDFLRFSAGVFSNLTRDHLDFHDSMHGYFLAKRRLFEMLPAGAPAIVNVDDAYGARLAAEFPSAVTYGLEQGAQVTAANVVMGLDGFTCEVRTPRGPLRLRSPLVGRPNLYNVLAAASAAVALDLPFGAIEAGIAALEQVPGRFQTLTGPDDDVTVIVDYAHTDDALRNLLETARPLARGRLITVFGCGGDRDRTKRPLMGAVAARLSDLIVLTSDNPRSEDPERIIDEIKRGIVPPDRPSVRGGQPVPAAPAAPWLALPDRREAILRAISEARPGDMVLVAGKGHERYQVIGDRTVPFDDAEVAREALAQRRERLSAQGRDAR